MTGDCSTQGIISVRGPRRQENVNPTVNHDCCYHTINYGTIGVGWNYSYHFFVISTPAVRNLHSSRYYIRRRHKIWIFHFWESAFCCRKLVKGYLFQLLLEQNLCQRRPKLIAPAYTLIFFKEADQSKSKLERVG